MSENRFDYAVVVFIDILGFREMVSDDAQSTNPRYLPRIIDTIHRVREQKTDTLSIESFSDSVIISAPLSVTSVVAALDTAIKLQRSFVLADVLVRGGVSFGKHYNQNNVLFSEALVSAYEHESMHAKVPRIVIDPNMLDWLVNHQDFTPQLRTHVNSLLCKDRDNWKFLHYIDDVALHHGVVLRRVKSKISNPSILEKIRWLVDYHNHCARRGGFNGLAIPGFEVVFDDVT